jgi:hypothetical protein
MISRIGERNILYPISDSLVALRSIRECKIIQKNQVNDTRLYKQETSS